MLLDKIDKLILLSGEPIPFGPLLIYQPTLKEIKKIGYNRFARLTNLITLQESDLLLFYEKEKDIKVETNPLYYLIEQSLKFPTFFLELQLAFFTYIKQEVFIDFKNKNFKIVIKNKNSIENSFIINNDNFIDFQKIIRLVNFNFEEEDPEIKTDNLEMKKKFEEIRKKLKLAKAKEKAKKQLNGKDLIDFSDIISSLCIFNNNYNLFNVWNLTVYQLLDQFKRCQMKEDYETGTQMLLAGADKKKIDLQYWIKNISNI